VRIIFISQGFHDLNRIKLNTR